MEGGLQQAALDQTDRKIVEKDLKLMEGLDQHIAEGRGQRRDLLSGIGVELLRTIVGRGKFLALLILYEMDRMGRFSLLKKVGSYVGLIPSL